MTTYKSEKTSLNRVRSCNTESSIHWQVNPYETDNVADVLDRALEMSLDERKLRMNQLKKRERRMDVDAWVRGFLQVSYYVSF